MRNILAAVDFSPISDLVIARASELAQAFGSALWLVHVAAPDPDFVGYESGPQSVRQTVAAELRDVHRQLQEQSATLRERGSTALPCSSRARRPRRSCARRTA